MSKLAIIKSRKMHALLLELDFQAVRQKGSPVFYRHSDGRTTTVPNHPGKDLGRPLIRKILRDIGVTPEKYHNELEKL